MTSNYKAIEFTTDKELEIENKLYISYKEITHEEAAVMLNEIKNLRAEIAAILAYGVDVCDAHNNLLSQRDELLEVLVKVDKEGWYDASKEDAGACMACDANLHLNSMGKHAQLNGDPCAYQMAHDVLVKIKGKK